MSTSLTFWALAVIALLGALILVHELGHYLFARIFDVKILRVSLGFGPKILGFYAGTTEYRLSLFPLGGYVRLLGEDPSEPVAPVDAERTLLAKPLWQRYAIVIAGPAFNLILPVVIYFFHYLGQGALLPPTIGTVLHERPAAEAGLVPGDRVESIDGRPIRYWEELESAIAAAPNRILRFGIRRGNVAEERDVRPLALERRGPLALHETVGWVGISPRFHLPEIGILDLSSPAAQAGLRTFDFITSVNGAPISHWAEFERAVAQAGASPLRITFLRGSQSALPFAHVEFQTAGTAVVLPQAVFETATKRRYETGLLSSEMFVFSVEPGSPADRLGIRHGDRIVALDGEAIEHWDVLMQKLTQNPLHTFAISWVSPGSAPRQGELRQEHRAELDAYHQEEVRLVFGAKNHSAWKTDAPVPIKSRFVYALGHSFSRAGKMMVAITQGFVEIVRGRMPLSSLGGPLTIGYVAGVAAEQGLDQYLWLMALLSINIALLNFLPIPLLDGGLLVFFTIELVKGRPPSGRARTLAANVGLVVVVLLMAFALKNDLVRFLFAR